MFACALNQYCILTCVVSICVKLTVAANIQKLLDVRESSSVTFALVSLRHCLFSHNPFFFFLL